MHDKDFQAHEATLSQIQQNFFGTSILTQQTEMHGKEIFHGKAHFKGRKLSDRLKLLGDFATLITSSRLPVRIVRIDLLAHRRKYRFAQPECQLGLMLILERFCDFLDEVGDLGLVFGDYEKDEITRAVLDFSQFKLAGRTTMRLGRPLGRLLDTIYFTHSHHSRFLQAADVMRYMASRCHGRAASETDKYHEKELCHLWESIKAGGQVEVQHRH
ncbi:MAG TPA: DUF3800 domain-containing protein [Verrucomicrobiae bacterium]